MSNEALTNRDLYKEISSLRVEMKQDLLIFKNEIKDEVNYLREDINKKFDMYTLEADFKPVRMIVYGIVTVILLGVMGALITNVIK